MIFRRYGTFTGGIDLPDEKQATLEVPIRPAGLPERLRVPLGLCGGPPAVPVVEVGRRVEAGERIAATADDRGVDVFAPLAGRVASLSAPVAVMGRGGFVESPAIELVELAEPAAAGAGEVVFDWAGAHEVDMLERIAAGHLPTFRGRPEPLAVWIRRARGLHCHTLVANALEQEPYVTADHRLLCEHGAEVAEGLAILGRAIAVRRTYLAADRRRTGDYADVDAAADRLRLTQIALPHRYPMGADAILAKVLTRRETAPGASPMSVGAAVVDAATCLAAYRWTVRGERAVGRVVTVGGHGVAEPANLWVPFGTACAELARKAEGPLIHGGPMTGIPCAEGAVVTSATTAVLALAADKPPLPSPCIRCGWCTDHCPARLNVSALNDAFELSLVDRARWSGALACVECGVCSYVCPARLPLAQRVKRLKRAILGQSQAAVGRGLP